MNHKVKKNAEIKNFLRITLRLVFSPPEFPFGHHVILLILSALVYEIRKTINIFGRNFD